MCYKVSKWKVSEIHISYILNIFLTLYNPIFFCYCYQFLPMTRLQTKISHIYFLSLLLCCCDKTLPKTKLGRKGFMTYRLPSIVGSWNSSRDLEGRCLIAFSMACSTSFLKQVRPTCLEMALSIVG